MLLLSPSLLWAEETSDLRKEIEELNERYTAKDLEYFSVSEDYATGFYEYLYRLKNHDNTMLDYLKG